MSVTSLPMPHSQRSKLAAAILSTLHLAGTFTDLVIHEGQPIRMKSANGIVDLSSLGLPNGDLIVTAADIKHFFASYVDGPPSQSAGSYWETNILPTLASKMAVNKTMATAGNQFLRFSLFLQGRGSLGMMVRVTNPPSDLDSIGLTPQIIDRVKSSGKGGLLIITGPTASGKTATALSILDWINHNRASHIVTVEDPIEYEMIGDKAIFTQREVGVDVTSFGEGLRDAMRHSPDAILAGEVRDRDTAESAILGGESGALMIVTTHGRSISGAMRKILTLTGEQSSSMREIMAGSLIGVVRQELFPKADKSGYVMCCDTLHMTDNVASAVEKGNWALLDKMSGTGALASADFIPMSARMADMHKNRII